MTDQDQLMLFTFVFSMGTSFLLLSGWLLVSAFKRWMRDE